MDEMDFFLYATMSSSCTDKLTPLFSEGEARMTLFAAEGNARTFDYQVCSQR
jgi:hypothetical protein